MARKTYPAPPIPEHIQRLADQLPLIDRIMVPRRNATFELCAGTPNTLFTQELRAAVGKRLKELGFRGAGYHGIHGYSLRNVHQELTPSHMALIREQLGPRYYARLEHGRQYSVILISVAEWFTATDIKNAMMISNYRTTHTHVVKADMATQVTGLVFEQGQGASDARNSYYIYEMENTLARPHVNVACSIEYMRMRGKDDVYDMVIRGTWTGDPDMTPAFMRRK